MDDTTLFQMTVQHDTTHLIFYTHFYYSSSILLLSIFFGGLLVYILGCERKRGGTGFRIKDSFGGNVHEIGSCFIGYFWALYIALLISFYCTLAYFTVWYNMSDDSHFCTSGTLILDTVADDGLRDYHNHGSRRRDPASLDIL